VEKVEHWKMYIEAKRMEAHGCREKYEKLLDE
jgi:hypothetical protein